MPTFSKHTMNLREGDLDYLSQAYSDRGVSATAVIRRLVSAHVDALRRKEPTPDLQLGVLLDD